MTNLFKRTDKSSRMEPLDLLHPSENLRQDGTAASGGKATFYSSPSYNLAIQASGFVKGFGITGLVAAILSLFIGQSLLLGGAIGLGIGLFIFRYDKAQFYRTLGAIVMGLAVIGGMLPFLSPGIISVAVLIKGKNVLEILSKEGHDDRRWQGSRKNTFIGMIASGGGILISLVSMIHWVLSLGA